MAGYDTVCGGHLPHDPGHGGGGGHGWGMGGGPGWDLTQAEKLAAQEALSKLSGGAGREWNFGHASPAGGIFLGSQLKALSGGLVVGKGMDTYAGGVASARHAIAKFTSDTVLGGSKALQPKSLESGVAFRLSSDTINIAGTTAAAVKSLDPAHGLHSSHTITLTDKTTLNITGVHGSDIVKPHGH